MSYEALEKNPISKADHVEHFLKYHFKCDNKEKQNFLLKTQDTDCPLANGPTVMDEVLQSWMSPYKGLEGLGQ